MPRTTPRMYRAGRPSAPPQPIPHTRARMVRGITLSIPPSVRRGLRPRRYTLAQKPARRLATLPTLAQLSRPATMGSTMLSAPPIRPIITQEAITSLRSSATQLTMLTILKSHLPQPHTTSRLRQAAPEAGVAGAMLAAVLALLLPHFRPQRPLRCHPVSASLSSMARLSSSPMAAAPALLNRRLHLSHRSHWSSPTPMVPQGALATSCRASTDRALEVVQAVLMAPERLEMHHLRPSPQLSCLERPREKVGLLFRALYQARH